ncbi:PqqD family peptide modification chaperone [candidate division KSB1 bacterium]|nr:PqqD family peptide modification chaperone [candidate division KSB1 bacterium]
MKNKESVNLLDLIPVQNVDSTTNDENLIVLLKPKLKNRYLKKYVLSKMKSPNYKINLDDFGTSVWKSINGRNTVAEIGDKLRSEFGEKIEPVYERLSLFIKILEKNKLITYRSQ